MANTEVADARSAAIIGRRLKDKDRRATESGGMGMAELFSPLLVRSLTLKNRIVMPPMANESATAEGVATEESFKYYEQRARGGTGLLIVEFTGGIVSPEVAESIVREGKADLIGIGRALLADPNWALTALQVLTG